MFPSTNVYELNSVSGKQQDPIHSGTGWGRTPLLSASLPQPLSSLPEGVSPASRGFRKLPNGSPHLLLIQAYSKPHGQASQVFLALDRFRELLESKITCVLSCQSLTLKMLPCDL